MSYERLTKPQRIFFKKTEEGYVLKKLLNISPRLQDKIGDILSEEDIESWVSDPDVDVIIR